MASASQVALAFAVKREKVTPVLQCRGEVKCLSSV